MDDLGNNVVDADSVEVVEYPALLVVEGIHRRRMLFEPQFHNNDILMFLCLIILMFEDANCCLSL